MNAISKILLTIFIISGLSVSVAFATETVKIANAEIQKNGDEVNISADIVLDAMILSGNKQIYITPVISSPDGNMQTLPSVLVNGKAMQIAYERKTLPRKFLQSHNLKNVVKRQNGKKQTIKYSVNVPFEKWMTSRDASLSWVADNCGCGDIYGSGTIGDPILMGLNPQIDFSKLALAYATPEVTELPESVHEGKAQVRFEVGSPVLHPSTFICRNGQRIDNSHELRIIDDSISNALKDKNVEIARIKICGYASPEGSYSGNDRLSKERSRSLALYIADRYKLPSGKMEYESVAENWSGLRDIVAKASDITAEQRTELLALIDRPAATPAEYDAKDQEMKKKFAKLYNGLILPQWYPSLRITKFEISTRLKPLSDEELAEVIRHTPEKMALNQMFRVAKLYKEGSDDFNRVINTALSYYPDNETANLNAACAALKTGDLDRAAVLLEKAGDSPQAANARGAVAAKRGDIETARKLFQSVSSLLPEAARNLQLLEE